MKRSTLILFITVALLGFQSCSSGFSTLSSSKSTPAGRAATTTPATPEPSPTVNPTSTPVPVAPRKASTILDGRAVTELVYMYNSGTVSPSYAYSAQFKIDFQTKSITVSINKGPNVSVALPLPGIRPLNDTQLSQLTAFFNQTGVSNCDDTPMMLGGPNAGIYVYTNSLGYVDSYLGIGQCAQPFSEISNQYSSTNVDSKALTDYIRSL